MNSCFEPFGQDYQAGTAAGANEIGLFLRLPGQWGDGTWQAANSGAGIYYNVWRFLEPQTGRYTRPDRARVLGISDYVYALADPISIIDPSGLLRRQRHDGRSPAKLQSSTSASKRSTDRELTDDLLEALAFDLNQEKTEIVSFDAGFQGSTRNRCSRRGWCTTSPPGSRSSRRPSPARRADHLPPAFRRQAERLARTLQDREP